MMIAATLLLIAITTTTRGAEDKVCLEKPSDGFILSDLTSNIPLPLVPESPSKVNTSFYMFTEKDKPPFMVNSKNVSAVRESKYNPQTRLVVLIHGYMESAEEWPTTMCQDILTEGNVTCIAVNYKNGADSDYVQAVQNTPVVAYAIACFLRTLEDICNCTLSKSHFMGHSLGAHVSGQAARRYFATTGRKIQRASGCDPAGPAFIKNSKLRMRPSDAVHTDVINSDASSFVLSLATAGYGNAHVCGQITFFPNGGRQQPGCPDNIFENLLDRIKNHRACNHVRSVELFSESVRDPKAFMAYRAESYEAFQNGSGFSCSNGSCARMGYHLDVNTLSDGISLYFLNTGANSPFTLSRCRVTINMTANGITQSSISISVSFHNSTNITPTYLIYSGRPISGSYISYLDIPMSAPLTAVTVTYSEPTAVHVSQVMVEYGYDNQTYTFCDMEQDAQATSRTIIECK